MAARPSSTVHDQSAGGEDATGGPPCSWVRANVVAATGSAGVAAEVVVDLVDSGVGASALCATTGDGVGVTATRAIVSGGSASATCARWVGAAGRGTNA